MNRKRTLIVILTLLVASLIAIGTYASRKHIAPQNKTIVEIKRTTRGLLPPLRSTVPGVTITGTIRETGNNNEYEALDLIINNDTDVAVEAYEISMPPQAAPPDRTVTVLTVSEDKRRPQFVGDIYKLKPAEALIGPHSRIGTSIPLSALPDDREVVLSAIAFSDGRVVGSHARDFKQQRAQEAKAGGFNSDEHVPVHDDIKLSGGPANQ